MEKERTKRKYSIGLVFIAIFFTFIALMTGLLNTYPTISSRDIVFSNKQASIMNQISVMSTSLSALERLSTEGVSSVMELIDVNSFDRVMVTDAHGSVIYDSADRTTTGTYALFTEVASALSGQAVFHSRYTGEMFLSHAAVPVVSYGQVIGSVYLCEQDTEQALVIDQIQGRLRSISIIAGIASILAVIVFTKALTRRITALVKAMRIVREGRYDYRICPKGNDEVTELAEEFNDMTGRLQSTEELRRRFVSDASHELRTPLASIRLLSDSIVQSESMDEETMREFVADIGSEAERLQRLTEKLMMLTKMDAQAEKKLERVNMKKVVDRTIHLLAPLARERDVKIYTELDDDCVIMASDDSVYQIIFNLAENAVKYNSFGGNVFIRLHRTDGMAGLIVEDTGIGIPDEDVQHIFSRFYRVDKARSRQAGGSGLGLSIVHDAVKSYGGSIKVERRDTIGTRFTVLFPLAGEAEHD